MSAKIIKIPQSMQKTHQLIDGELVRKSTKPVFKRKIQDHWAVRLVASVIVIGMIWGSIHETKKELRVTTGKETECLNFWINEDIANFVLKECHSDGYDWYE